MRGRGGISEAAMIAEIAAMRWAEDQGMSQADVRLEQTDFPSPADAEGPIIVSVQVRDALLGVALSPLPLLMAGHCDVLEAGEGKPGFRWVQIGIGPLSSAAPTSWVQPMAFRA